MREFKVAKVGDLVQSRRVTDTQVYLVCRVEKKCGVNVNEGLHYSYLLDSGKWVWGRQWLVISDL